MYVHNQLTLLHLHMTYDIHDIHHAMSYVMYLMYMYDTRFLFFTIEKLLLLLATVFLLENG